MNYCGHTDAGLDFCGDPDCDQEQMTAAEVAAILDAISRVAALTVLAKRGNSARIIESIGDVFAASLREAMGR